MKRNTVRDQKDFIEKAIAILDRHGAIQLDDEGFRFEIRTDTFGEVYVRVDSDNTYNYSIYMRFDSLDLDTFYKHFSKSEVINTHSGKWNLHDVDKDYILQELEDRLEVLTTV